MDFDLTDEQRLLKDSVERLIADHYAFEQRKKYMAEPAGWSTAVWNQYAELGLLGLPFEETLGGFGGAGRGRGAGGGGGSGAGACGVGVSV